MRALVLLALSFPATALAGSALDKWSGSVDTVEIADLVEVPLYSGAYGDELPYIHVDIEGSTWRFLIDPGQTGVVVNSTIADDYGSGVKTRNKNVWASLFVKEDDHVYGPEGKIKTTTLDELQLAEGLVLKGIQARVLSIDPTPFGDLEHERGTTGGIIGGNVLGIPIAVLPSEGVVRFAPADQGQTLLSQLGGTPIPYQSIESMKMKLWAGKTILPTIPMVVEASLAGQPALAIIGETFLGAIGDPALVPEGAPSFRVGDSDGIWAQASLGGVELKPGWFLSMDLVSVPGKEDYWSGLPRMAIGFDVLRYYDWAVDPANMQMALALAEDQKREWGIEGFISARDTELKELEEKKAEAEEWDDDAEKKQGEERADILVAKGWYQMMAAQVDAAIASYEEATQLDADPCEHWARLSDAYWVANRFDDALAANQKALDRYAAWAALSREERKEIEELDEEEQEASGVQPQSLDECYDVPGRLAGMTFAAGDAEAALALHKEHTDLHANIDVVAGVAHVVAGQPDKAQGPLRQALMKGGDYDLAARMALATVYLQSGDADTAMDNWEREGTLLANVPCGVEIYADLLAARDGEAAVIPGLQALADGQPDNPVVRTVLGSELAARGGDAQAAFAEAAALIDEITLFRPNVSAAWSLKAYHLVAASDLEGAREAAEKALELNPADPYALTALMDIEAAAGNGEAAMEYHRLAQAHAVGNVCMATMPAPVAQAPVPTVKVAEGAIEIGENVYFDSGAATIQERSNPLLDEIARVLGEHPELLRISIEGHTDASGNASDNLKLSQERAQAVMDYLVAKGVEAKRLRAKGFGQSKPIADNETDEGKAANRRVEFIISKKAK